MDWRLISAVTMASASFGVVVCGAYTLRAADAVAADVHRTVSPKVAPLLMPVDAAGAQQPSASRGVSFVPVAPAGDAFAAPATQWPQHSGVQPAAGTAPFAVADVPVLSKERDNGEKAWKRRHRGVWRLGHHVKFCTVLRPCVTDRKQQAAVRHDGGEEQQQHSVPRIALLLGVGF